MAMLAALDLVTFDDCEAEDLKCRDDESERLKQRGNVAYKVERTRPLGPLLHTYNEILS